MTDPYNSHVSTNGPTVTPDRSEASPATKANSIVRSRLSPSWKRKFRLIDRAGGAELPEYRTLSAKDHLSINFNILAFIFGPLYYLTKGLFRQAILYFSTTALLLVVLAASELEILSLAVVIGVAFICAFRANISYYRKVVLGSAPWF